MHFHTICILYSFLSLAIYAISIATLFISKLFFKDKPSTKLIWFLSIYHYNHLNCSFISFIKQFFLPFQHKFNFFFSWSSFEILNTTIIIEISIYFMKNKMQRLYIMWHFVYTKNTLFYKQTCLYNNNCNNAMISSGALLSKEDSKTSGKVR